MPADGSLIYCDTNVYSRPFDDQTRSTIREESNAFLEIMSRVRGGELRLLCSDSAITGRARYFLSCDNNVTQIKQARCYRRLAKGRRVDYFSAMNPTRFSDKLQKGEIE